jgi:hypothetical protein
LKQEPANISLHPLRFETAQRHYLHDRLIQRFTSDQDASSLFIAGGGEPDAILPGFGREDEGVVWLVRRGAAILRNR